MIAIDFFKYPAALLAWFYSLTHNYILAIGLIALVVMVITAPLVLKSTKGMLEMQKLQPEMRRLQQQYRGDRQKLNEEMMKLYQEHKVNPLASCFPLLLQMPVFIIMFRVLHGVSEKVSCVDPGAGKAVPAVCKGILDGRELIVPKYISASSKMYESLYGQTQMKSFGLDLAVRPINMLSEGFGKGMVYALLVVALGALYYGQQRMVAARASVSPTMSATQQKIMQYLPVAFAVFLVFYLTGLVIYYMAQAVFRIALQYYITHRFYKGDESLGRQAQRAGETARELAKADGGGGGMFAQAKRDLAAAKEDAAKKKTAGPDSTVSKRVTPPKGKPTGGATGRNAARPQSSGRAGRPGGPANRPPKKK